ncbi:MAG: hypothetical protein R3E52_03280 [Burkholderiaceae bacterium]
MASLRRVQIGMNHAAAVGVHEGEWVKVVTPQGAVQMKVQVSATLNASGHCRLRLVARLRAVGPLPPRPFRLAQQQRAERCPA